MLVWYGKMLAAQSEQLDEYSRTIVKLEEEGKHFKELAEQRALTQTSESISTATPTTIDD